MVNPIFPIFRVISSAFLQNERLTNALTLNQSEKLDLRNSDNTLLPDVFVKLVKLLIIYAHISVALGCYSCYFVKYHQHLTVIVQCEDAHFDFALDK